MADVVVDFLTPTEKGPTSAFIDRYGERIRALNPAGEGYGCGAALL